MTRSARESGWSASTSSGRLATTCASSWAGPTRITLQSGEDVRIIPVHLGEWPADLQGHGYDSWLFDSWRLAAMHYDHEGRFVAIDLVADPHRCASERVA